MGVCEFCKQEFPQVRKDKRFCTDVCRSRANRAMRRRQQSEIKAPPALPPVNSGALPPAGQPSLAPPMSPPQTPALSHATLIEQGIQAQRTRLGRAPVQVDYALTLLARRHAATWALQTDSIQKQLAQFGQSPKVLSIDMTTADVGRELGSHDVVDPSTTHIGVGLASTEKGRLVVALVVGRAKSRKSGGVA